MSIFSKTKVANEKFYGPKQTMKIWDLNVDSIVISILVDTKKINLSIQFDI